MSGLTALHLAAMKGYNDLVFSLITQHHSQKDALTLVRLASHSQALNLTCQHCKMVSCRSYKN